MIIGKGRSYTLSEFLTRLEEAGRGVLRVETRTGGGNYWCTGWLLTDRLVAVPGFAIAGPDVSAADRLYSCWAANGAETAEADLVHEPIGHGPTLPALLQLRTPLQAHPLELDFSTPDSNQRILVLHYPRGERAIRLSLGRVLNATRKAIHHDAATEPGSSGAPVLSADSLGVIGLHVAGSASAGYNEAVSLAEVLDELRLSPFWDDIANPHRLADVGAVRRSHPVADPSVIAARETETAPHSDLLAAALRWSIDPDELHPAAREALRPLVGDAEAPTWSLLPDERRRLITEAGSLDALRGARTPESSSDPGQRTIDRILDGPPFDLATVPDHELPYWLQAVGWFADSVPDLPIAADVHQTLARRRVRGRLRGLAGPKLWGRETKLRRLLGWYADVNPEPMAITGIGGVGKSALVAGFALELPEDTVILWLDFDRADLAPDDAVSVLAALAAQMAVQLDDVAVPTIEASRWEQGADELATVLAEAVAGGAAPLLVLDGFEIAQHAERHDEIWGVLERLLARLPALHVVVSGRAPVPGLTLAGRHAKTMPLTGLTRRAARAWLLDQGLDESALAAVLRVANGVPLALKMAVRLVEAGGDVGAVPDWLPRALVEGYLYQRILDRVVDPALRALARDALVLRRLTAEMIPAVFGDRIPAGLDPPTAFARLSRELALVETIDGRPPATGTTYTGPLRLRPEVRTATLRLLELDDAPRVREIDRRAAAWYAVQDLTDPSTAAELVYHYLRLGEVAAAEHAWRDGCAPPLWNAEEDIPESFPAARAWLRSRTTGKGQPAIVAEVWEQEAYTRIRRMLNRGLVRGIPPMLQERPERSPGSPLVSYDAWVRWRVDGDLAQARGILAGASPADGSVRRERAVLGALLAAADNDPRAADALLAPFDNPKLWRDRKEGDTEALALRAARVRLTVDLSAELELARLLESVDEHHIPEQGPGEELSPEELRRSLRQMLDAGDLVLPSLSRTMDLTSGDPTRIGAKTLDLEGYRTPLDVPHTTQGLDEFAERFDFEQRQKPPPLRALELTDHPADAAWTPQELGLRASSFTPQPVSGLSGQALELGLGLAVRAARRWQIAVHTFFLTEAYQALARSRAVPALRLSISNTLAVFRGQPLQFSDGEHVDGFFKSMVLRQAFLPAERELLDDPSPTALAALQDEQRRLHLTASIERLQGKRKSADPSEWWQSLPRDGWDTGFNTLAVYLLGPDPLDVLHRQVLGIPETSDRLR